MVTEKCSYCGGANIKRDIQVQQNAEVGLIGLEYQSRFALHGVEGFHADLCVDCGSICRLWVQKTDRNWCFHK